MNIRQSIVSAFEAMRAQKLRSGLTLVSIAIGVFAIVASTAVTSSLQQALGSQLSDLGENSFIIMRTPTMQMGNSWRKYRARKNLTPNQAQELRRRITTSPYVSISNTNPLMIVQSGLESTNPDVQLIGVDELYAVVQAINVDKGRAFVEQDVALAKHVAIIGNDVATTLFGAENPLQKTITMKNHMFTVVGVLETKGGILGQSQDNRVLIPMSVFLKYYTWEWDASVDITIKAVSKQALPATIDEARGIMRTLRECKPWQADNFELETNEAISHQFSNFSQALIGISWFSGFGALVAAGIGIMNMMLVSVRERTREIGVRKALGARRRWITQQFMIESVTLGLVGGCSGIFLGMVFSWVVGLLVQMAGITLTIAVPWFAVLVSIAACTAVGLLAGVYPASKAASLNPIEALRYE
jgi:putative ABC transport system permease protein